MAPLYADASVRCIAAPFVRGEGNYLVDSRGHKVFDAVSSIWTTIHGHSHPHIVAAIAKQAAQLDHATTLGATNPVAEELAERLCSLTSLDYTFFASDGASAVEAALKMALQYWQNSGQPRRKRFVKLVHAYHGDTVGAMSVSDIDVFKERFGAVTFETLAYTEASDIFARDDIAAIIVEPIVQAAAGMRIIPKTDYDGLRNIKPLLIVDEFATGFGRTGTMLAFEQLELSPDIVCVGKGITGGTLALSATLVRKHIYEAFLGVPEERKHFFHGHSYAGNPIACAAALASLELFERESTLANVRSRAEQVGVRLKGLKNAHVRDVRQSGLMVGIELAATEGDDAQGLARTIAERLYTAGHFTRPIGNVVQFVPPLSSKANEIDKFFDAFERVLCA